MCPGRVVPGGHARHPPVPPGTHEKKKMALKNIFALFFYIDLPAFNPFQNAMP
jgi:hypothetical protein